MQDVGSLLSQSGIMNGGNAAKFDLVKAWPEIIGPDMAGHVSSLAIANGTLRLAVG